MLTDDTEITPGRIRLIQVVASILVINGVVNLVLLFLRLAKFGFHWLMPVGWIAVLLIFCAAAFFLKYAFENRWIGELGRVSIGVAAGLRCWACASGAPSIWRER